MCLQSLFISPKNNSLRIGAAAMKRNGFTLIEVLISIFVLALGVIGAAGMQLTALRTAHQSAFQSTAMMLASELADKMRANTRQSTLPDNANPFLGIDYQAAKEAVIAPQINCYASSCNAEALAKFDIDEWKARIKTALPNARVRICRDVRPWDKSVGAFTWACTAPAGNAQGASFVIKIGWSGKGRTPDGKAIKDSKEISPPGLAMTVLPYTQ